MKFSNHASSRGKRSAQSLPRFPISKRDPHHHHTTFFHNHKMSSTIVNIKETFLQTQIRTLSQDLVPTPEWRGNTSTASSQHRDLRAKEVSDALRELNAKLKVHNLLVYNGASRRHIAEQIERLYWEAAGERERGAVGVVGEECLERGADYCMSSFTKQIAFFPYGFRYANGNDYGLQVSTKTSVNSPNHGKTLSKSNVSPRNQKDTRNCGTSLLN